MNVIDALRHCLGAEQLEVPVDGRDSMVFTPEGLRHLVAEVGASQIVMGTDYPFPWTTTSVDYVLITPGPSDADRGAILGETTAKLLDLKQLSSNL